MTGEPTWIMNGVAVGYGRRVVLQGLNATLAQGDAVGLLGANGSGKTTLLKTMAGILPLLGGKMSFNDGQRPVVGYVPQRESLDQAFLLSNREIVLMGACGRVGPGRPVKKSERDFALECLERTGAGSLAQKPFAEISGGQKQRVLIARALLARPDLLLLDEPTAGVDAAATVAISDLLRKLNAEGMTLLMVNHDLSVTRSVARTIWRVREGALETGPIEEMLRTQRMEGLPVE